MTMSFPFLRLQCRLLLFVPVDTLLLLLAVAVIARFPTRVGIRPSAVAIPADAFPTFGFVGDRSEWSASFARGTLRWVQVGCGTIRVFPVWTTTVFRHRPKRLLLPSPFRPRPFGRIPVAVRRTPNWIRGVARSCVPRRVLDRVATPPRHHHLVVVLVVVH
jgi:hypothetical protein